MLIQLTFMLEYTLSNIKICVFCYIGGRESEFRVKNHGLNLHLYIILAFYHLNVGSRER
jgi:hypothetical protein